MCAYNIVYRLDILQRAINFAPMERAKCLRRNDYLLNRFIQSVCLEGVLKRSDDGGWKPMMTMLKTLDVLKATWNQQYVYRSIIAASCGIVRSGVHIFILKQATHGARAWHSAAAPNERIRNYIPPVKLLTSSPFYNCNQITNIFNLKIIIVLVRIRILVQGAASGTSDICEFLHSIELKKWSIKIIKYTNRNIQWQILRDRWHCKGCCLPKKFMYFYYFIYIQSINKWFHFIVGNACHFVGFGSRTVLLLYRVIDPQIQKSTNPQPHTLTELFRY